MLPDAVRPLLVAKFVPPPFAGVEAHVDTLARALLPHAAPTVVAGHPWRQVPHPAAPYRVLTAASFTKLASVYMSPGVVNIIRTELGSDRCNLLHHHAPNPWGDLGSLVARDVPVVMTWHSDIVRQKNLLRVYGPIQRSALRRADKVIVFTRNHYESSLQLKIPGLEHKIEVVPIGIDFASLDQVVNSEAFRQDLCGWAAGRPLILTVGRQVYYKGYHHLLSAVARMRSEAVLALVGTGPLGAQLRQQAHALGIASRVRFLGTLDLQGMVTAMRACDIFTLPSIAPAEAFGIASAEAMSCGKPTVVCALGNGVDHLNQHGRTSLAVPPGDEAALADALDQLARDRALRLRMGQEASTWVRSEFSVDAMVRGTMQLYRSLL